MSLKMFLLEIWNTPPLFWVITLILVVLLTLPVTVLAAAFASAKRRGRD